MALPERQDYGPDPDEEQAKMTGGSIESELGHNRLMNLYRGVRQVADIGGYDYFRKAMKDPGRRRAFYDKVSNYADIGEWEKFNDVVKEYSPNKRERFWQTFKHSINKQSEFFTKAMSFIDPAKTLMKGSIKADLKRIEEGKEPRVQWQTFTVGDQEIPVYEVFTTEQIEEMFKVYHLIPGEGMRAFKKTPLPPQPKGVGEYLTGMAAYAVAEAPTEALLTLMIPVAPIFKGSAALRLTGRGLQNFGVGAIMEQLYYDDHPQAKDHLLATLMSAGAYALFGGMFDGFRELNPILRKLRNAKDRGPMTPEGREELMKALDMSLKKKAKAKAKQAKATAGAEPGKRPQLQRKPSGQGEPPPLRSTYGDMPDKPTAIPEGPKVTIEAGDFDAMLGELEGATLMRSHQGWSYSTAPEWFKRLNRAIGKGKDRLGGVVNKKDVMTVIQKVRDGKDLTANQQDLWDNVLDSYLYEKGKAVSGQAPKEEIPTRGPKVTIEAGDFDAMLGELEGATLMRSHQGWSYSTAPEWFKRLNRAIGKGKDGLGGVVNKKDVMTVIRKVRDGKDLTANQQDLWDNVLDSYLYEKGKAVSGQAPKEEIPTRGPKEGEEPKTYWEKHGEDPFIEDVGSVEEGMARWQIYKEEADIDPFQQFGEKVDAAPIIGWDEFRQKYRALYGVEPSYEEWQKIISSGDYMAGTESFLPEMMNVSDDWVEGPVSRQMIHDYIEQEFGVPIYKGSRGGGRKKSVRGQYSSEDRVVFEKDYADIPVEAHEAMGHWLDDEIQATKKITNQDAVRQLRNLDYDQKAGRVREGFAEMIRYDLTADTAKRQAPTAYEHFRRILDNNPEIKKKYDTLKAMYRKYYYEMGAQQRVRKSWVKQEPKEPVTVPRVFQWFYRKFVDALEPIKTITAPVRKAMRGGPGIEPSKDPLAIADYLRMTSRSRAESWVLDKTRDVWGRETGKGLYDILGPVLESEETLYNFIDYTLAKRTITLANRAKHVKEAKIAMGGKFEGAAEPIHTGINLRDAEFTYNKFYDDFDDIANEFSDWANRSLDYLAEAGGLSDEAKKYIDLVNPFYTTMRRVVDFDKVGSGVGGYVNRGPTIKKMKGGGEQIMNPLLSMIDEVHRIIAAADKIRVARTLKEFVDENKLGHLMTKASPPMQAKKIKLGDIAPKLEDMGINFEDATDMNKFLTLFFPSFEGKGDMVSFWSGGQRQWYHIKKPMRQALDALNPAELPVWFSTIFGVPARTFRLLTTGINPAFTLRNFQRDVMTAIVYTKGSGVTMPGRAMKGIWQDIFGGQYADLAKAVGLEMSTMMSHDMKKLQHMGDYMLKKKMGVKGKAMFAVKHPIDALRRVVEVTELGPRIAEFENVLKRSEARWGKGSPNAMIEAFNSARDLTVNFSRSGVYGRWLNQMIPFWNAAMQGSEKMIREARQNAPKFVTRGTVAMTIPSVALWAWNHDKDWYKELPLQYKYNNWFFELDSGDVVRVPKPFELGHLFGGFAEALLDQHTGLDEDAIAEFGGLFLKNLPEMNPTDVLKNIALQRPYIEIMRNEDWLGRKIETETMKRMREENRTRNYTSEFAKLMTKTMRTLRPEGDILSPVQWDHLLNGYTGGQWRSWQGAEKYVTGKKMEKWDLPIVGTEFLNMATAPRRSVNKAYNYAIHVEQVRASFLHNRKNGRPEEAREIWNRYPELRYHKQIRQYRRKITDILRKRANAQAEQIKKLDEDLLWYAQKITDMVKGSEGQ